MEYSGILGNEIGLIVGTSELINDWYAYGYSENMIKKTLIRKKAGENSGANH